MWVDLERQSWTPHCLDCNIRTGRSLDSGGGPCVVRRAGGAAICLTRTQVQKCFRVFMSLGALCLARGEIGANQSRGANKVFFSQFKIGNIFRTGGKRIDSPGEKWQRLGWKTSVRSFGKTPSAPTEGEPPKVGFEGSARGRAFGPACILPTGDQPSVIYIFNILP